MEQMIDFWTHNHIAHERHEKLLADAERYRLARSARDGSVYVPEQRGEGVLAVGGRLGRLAPLEDARTALEAGN